MCEAWPQHRGLRALLFSNSGVGSFTSHMNKISVSAVRRDLRFFEKTRKSNRWQMSLQKQHFLLSYLKTLSVGPAVVRTCDPGSADRRSTLISIRQTDIDRLMIRTQSKG